MRIVFATGNKDKLREIRAIFADTGCEVVSMRDAGVNVSIDENGKTFSENARIKARTVSRALRDMKGADFDDIVMADDSGLVVDALGGEPGIYSARYMGEDTDYGIKNASIIERLSGVTGADRSARFTAAIACVMPDGDEFLSIDHMEGIIADRPAGDNGFGYDPILFLPEYGMTSAELPMEEKNKISHRGKALEAMKLMLVKKLSR